jgi:hypothetical protein
VETPFSWPSHIKDVFMGEIQLIEQLEDGARQPGIEIVSVEEPDKRTPPPEVSPYGPTSEIAALTGEPAAPGAAPPVLVGFPTLRWTRYASSDQEFRELVSWQIPVGYVGDLHEICLQSDNDSKTRYRITIADIDQQVPVDRELSTPVDLKWRDTVLPGPASVMVETRSTDGTTITVDGFITGTYRTPPTG